MVRNERLKLAANFVNAIGLGLIAIAVLRPVIETGSYDYLTVVAWALFGLALHGVAHYLIGLMR
jgi:hypothetical protein